MKERNKREILIVDDNSQNIQFLGRILEENDFTPILARNGEQALILATKEEPDLILLDIMMPGMDGFEVCTRLKEMPQTEHIPIIFLTSITDKGNIVRAFELGGVDYVTKPFNPAELLARVKTHVEMKILRGILPICANCKNVRDDQGYWSQIEAYVTTHSEALFSHGICPECAKILYGDASGVI